MRLLRAATVAVRSGDTTDRLIVPYEDPPYDPAERDAERRHQLATARAREQDLMQVALRAYRTEWPHARIDAVQIETTWNVRILIPDKFEI